MSNKSNNHLGSLQKYERTSINPHLHFLARDLRSVRREIDEIGGDSQYKNTYDEVTKLLFKLYQENVSIAYDHAFEVIYLPVKE